MINVIRDGHITTPVFSFIEEWKIGSGFYFLVHMIGTVFYHILVMRELLLLVNSAYTFYQIKNRNNACKSK